MKFSHRTRKIVIPLALAATMLNACATKDEPAKETTEKPAEEPSKPKALSVNVTARDYGYDGLPGTIKAGTTIKFTNSSTKEAHELVAFKLPETETRSVADLFALPQAEFEKVIGGGPPSTVIVAPPSAGGRAVLGDGSLKQPGRYAIACFIPTGADPAAFLAAAEAAAKAGGEPATVPGGPPHFTQGMFAEVTVE